MEATIAETTIAITARSPEAIIVTMASQTTIAEATTTAKSPEAIIVTTASQATIAEATTTAKSPEAIIVTTVSPVIIVIMASPAVITAVLPMDIPRYSHI